MQVISADDVRRLLPAELCVEAIRKAMVDFSLENFEQPLRTVIEVGDQNHFGMMPGRLAGSGDFGAKLVSVFPASDGRRQRHQGVVVLFEAKYGQPICIVDAEAITSIRTAAATAVATQALARADARHLVLFGCGTQAAAHVEVLTALHDYTTVTVWSRNFDRARQFAEVQSRRLDRDIRATTSAAAAAGGADVICTVTTADTPVLHGAWVKPGTHVNLIGSSVPGPIEADHDLIAKGRLFVDSEASARAQAAEYLDTLAAGRIGRDHIVAEIGRVLAGLDDGRRTPDEITIYKSLGLVVQDLAAARAVYGRASLDRDARRSTDVRSVAADRSR